jgi:hypothetical protein
VAGARPEERACAIGGRWLTFSMTVAGEAGAITPEPVGALAGAPVEAYV